MCVQDQPHLLVLEGDLPGGRSNNDVGITSSHKLRDANVGFGQAYHIANKWAPIPCITCLHEAGSLVQNCMMLRSS